MIDGEENKKNNGNEKPRAKILNFIKLIAWIICSILVTVTIFGLYFYVSAPSEFSEFFDKISKHFSDISVAHFEKFERQPGIYFCDIKGYPVDFKFAMQIAYTGKQIILGNSLLMNAPIKTIDVPGIISSVDCYFKANFSYEAFDFTNQHKQRSDGLFVACTYIANNKRRLVLYQIPYSCFKDFEVYLNFNKEIDSKAKKDFEDIINKSKDDEKKYAQKIYSLFSDSSSYPYSNISKQFDIDFENQKLLDYATDYGGKVFLLICNHDLNIVSLYDNNGTLVSTVKINKNAMVRIISSNLFSDVYIVNGNDIELSNVINGKIKQIASTKLPISNDDEPAILLNGSSDLFANDHDHLMLCQANIVYQLAKIQEYKNDELKTKGLELTRIKNLLNAKKAGIDSVSSDDETDFFYYDLIGKDEIYVCNSMQCNLLSQNFFDYRIRDKSEGVREETSLNRFISLILDQNSEPMLLFNTRTTFKSFGSSGIDEPVDEAHVTYEDGRLTVYFMNKNSIYRWQNTQEGIDNLKLRKLDIKPEPIKTVNN